MPKLFPIILFLIVLSNSSCNDQSVGNDLSRLEITSFSDLLDLNESMVLQLNGFDQANKPLNITNDIHWSVNNTNATIQQNGTLTGLKVGMTVVSATVLNITTTYNIEIWDSKAKRIEVYVSDAGNLQNGPWQILRFTEKGERPVSFINTHLGWPQDILFLEERGIVLVSNLTTGQINKYDITTGEFKGIFASGISGPTRMKVGPENYIYVLQWGGNGKVIRYQTDGTRIDEFTNVGVFQSIGLAWDVAGNLYVSSFNNGNGGSVRKFDQNGKDLGLFVTSVLKGPTNIWFDSEGILLINDWQNGVVRRFDSNGEFLNNLITNTPQAEGVDFLDNGNMLIGIGGSKSVNEYSQDGLFVKNFILPGAGQLIKPNAVVVRRVNY